MALRDQGPDRTRRDFLGLTRGTLRAVDDGKMAQTIDVDLLSEESSTGVEHIQQYGFSSHAPLDGKAEVLIARVGANGSYPTGFVSHRPSRPRNRQPGDSVMYDNRNQITEMIGDGIRTTTPFDWSVDAGGNVTIKAGGNISIEAAGKITLTAPDIVTDGFTHIGGEGGVPVSKEGTIDTGGFADVGSLASRATVK